MLMIFWGPGSVTGILNVLLLFIEVYFVLAFDLEWNGFFKIFDPNCWLKSVFIPNPTDESLS